MPHVSTCRVWTVAAEGLTRRHRIRLYSINITLCLLQQQITKEGEVYMKVSHLEVDNPSSMTGTYTVTVSSTVRSGSPDLELQYLLQRHEGAGLT